MNIAGLIITFICCGVVLYGVEPAQSPEDNKISELRSLVLISPTKRTKDQKERIREIWRSSAKLRDFFHDASVLQVGDSVFDFPGVIQRKDIEYDQDKKEYRLNHSYSVDTGDGNDHWVTSITFSGDGIVTNKQRSKMNPR